MPQASQKQKAASNTYHLKVLGVVWFGADGVVGVDGGVGVVGCVGVVMVVTMV